MMITDGVIEFRNQRPASVGRPGAPGQPGSRVIEQVLIAGGQGGLVEVAAGQHLHIITVAGRQICDFFAFRSGNLAESLSPAHTRTMLDRVVMRVGDEILSRYRNPMFEIVADSYAHHDFTQSACDPIVYERRYGIAGHRSCRTNLAEAMAGRNIPYECLPDPFNLFQNTPLKDDGTYESGLSTAEPGDSIILRAMMDVIAVGSSCPFDSEITGEAPTAIRFIVRN